MIKNNEEGKLMFQKIKLFLMLYSATVICGIVTVVAPLIMNECEFFWYQEIEPEGLREFCAKAK